MDFFRKNIQYYQNTRSMAKVALLRSYPTLLFNSKDAYLSTLYFEQVLIQTKIPFDIIFDENLTDLERYSVLILPNVESLSERQAEFFRNYVKNGGAIVATEQTSLYDEFRRKRDDFALNDVFGISHNKISGQTEHENVYRNTCANGRSSYITHIKPSLLIPDNRISTNGIYPECIALPKNYQKMVEEVLWATANNIGLFMKAPLSVVQELLYQEKEKRIILHVLNYDLKKNYKDIEIRLSIPDKHKVKEIMLLELDKDEPLVVPYTKQHSDIVFTIAHLEIYALIVIDLHK
jgi:hypothetical protein